MMRLLARRATALGALGLLAAAAYHYPAPPMLGVLLVGYMALLWWRPALWLLLVPATLPLLDFAPWSGWFFLEELDLVLLATCAVGYWRLGADAAPTKLPTAARVALWLFAACYLLAAWRGIWPLAPLDLNAFSNYVSPYNGLRVLKGVLWPLLMLPLLRASAGEQGVNLPRLLAPGMLLGLTACSLAVIWERLAFPGLFNFASDYRPTAPFSAMHTGGAALDAYLAMAFPFVALFLQGKQTPLRLLCGLAALALGVFAGLTTFSRDIYLAYAAAGAVIAVLGAAHHLRSGSLSARTMVATTLLLLTTFWVLTRVFAHGGYRGLLAALLLLGTALLLAGAAQRAARPLLVLPGAALLAALVAALTWFTPGAGSATAKGVYLGYGLTLACAGAGALWLGLARRPLGVLLLAVALPAQALAAVLVARHYGGDAAMPGMALAIVLALALAASRWLPQPLWTLNRGTLTLGFFSAIVLAALVPVMGSYYTGSRFATVADDLQVRLDHWSEALDMMDEDWPTRMLGQGLGRYPATYLWRNTHGETPGTFTYGEDADGNRFLRLGSAQYARGYGEVLRMLQHVAVRPGQRYRLQLDARSTDAAARPSLMVCERWLIYPQNCSTTKLVSADQRQDGWQTLSGELAPRAASNAWGAPLQLEISNGSGKAALDIDNVSLRNIDSGQELLANGDFSAGNDYWFFSSDRNHMPWHVKNFAVNQVFELGWLGALATAFLLLALGGRMVARGLSGDSFAAVSLAALTGCMMVGLFDSITDVPRLTIVFLLLALAGSLRPARRRIKLRRQQAQEDDALIA